MQNYSNVLCVNSWQVKRYIDVYSSSSLIGFSAEDMLHIAGAYAQANENRKHTTKLLLNKTEDNNSLLPDLMREIEQYSNFLTSVAELARSKWTEFNLKMMTVGLGAMITSLVIHILAIYTICKETGVSLTSLGDSGIAFGFIFACFVVVIRAGSFLSNSYILEEGKVANFLLATIGFSKLRHSIMKEKKLLEASVFLFILTACRFMIEVGLSKQGATSLFLKAQSSWVVRMATGPVWLYIVDVVPLLILLLLVYMLYRAISCRSYDGIPRYVIMGTIINYMFIALQWASESRVWIFALAFDAFGRNLIARIVYVIGAGQFSTLMFSRPLKKSKLLDSTKILVVQTVSMLSAWSSIVILLSGKQGPSVALACIIGGYCIVMLDSAEQDANHGIGLLPMTSWNLLAVCLFFCSGHWCAFDGLRYGAAFIGFDEFILIPQAILLTIDTFGFSHFLPIFGLPLLAQRFSRGNTEQGKQRLLMHLTLVYLMYGLIVATTVMATMFCVTIHRRHLMVWGLFAPKFVFDVVSLALSDFLICLASLFILRAVEEDELNNQITEKTH